MAGKFQIKSRAWNVGVAVGSAVLLVVGYGTLFLLRGSTSGAATATMLFLVFLGVVTTVLFAGPGILYSARKRIKRLKSALPGGQLAWIRSHLYLPILALVAAFVHATAAPFRAYLSSGKVLLVLGVLVSISGLCRHHLIGIQKAALNVNVAVNKLTTGQPRAFRALVADFTDNRRPLVEIEADAARLDPPLQDRWRRIKDLYAQVEKHFPRTGGQRNSVRHYKLWRAIHPPLTVALFVVLGYHVWDVVGAGDAVVAGDGEQAAFAASQQCAGCHSSTFSEWATSSMAHAQTSTITKAQLPITLAENQELADELGGDQEDRLEAASKTCVNCHAQVGGRFAEELDTLLPLGAPGSEGVGEGGTAVSGGGAASQSDGVGCIVCHSQSEVPSELSGTGELLIDTGGAADYGSQYGPLFRDPGPLPVRVHGMGAGEDDLWDTTVGSSQVCGACHNVKVDMDDDGVSDIEGAEEGLDDDDALEDLDGDFQLDQNEVDDSDDDGQADDLVLQTTFDEWQDYVAGFEERYEDDEDQILDAPLGCNECHMPSKPGDPTSAVVDHAPGLLAVPERTYRSHSFVGVDYELSDDAYGEPGVPEGAREAVLAERAALLESAATLEVVDPGVVDGDLLTASVVVRNNYLSHSFPTGFAFARQVWLEVTAETASGEPVCLDDLGGALPSPCGSGLVDDDDEDLAECDPASVAVALGTAVEDTPNGQVTFAPGAAQPVGECDPWLANYQKILTDGDDGVDDARQEVPYQPFLPGAVLVRERVATLQPMTELQPVRLRCVPVDVAATDEGPCTLEDGSGGEGVLSDDSAGTYEYDFDTSGVADGEEVVVTARLRFRHLPPYFLQDLEERQEDLGDDVPADARIEADELLANLVITDVVEARSGEGEQLACEEGPQNVEGGTILACLEEGAGVVALGEVGPEEAAQAELGGEGMAEATATATASVVPLDLRSLLPEGPLVLVGAAATALVVRRRRWRRA